MAPATLQARNERHSMSFSPEYKGWILTEQSMLCWVPRGWRRGVNKDATPHGSRPLETRNAENV